MCGHKAEGLLAAAIHSLSHTSLCPVYMDASVFRTPFYPLFPGCPCSMPSTFSSAALIHLILSVRSFSILLSLSLAHQSPIFPSLRVRTTSASGQNNCSIAKVAQATETVRPACCTHGLTQRERGRETEDVYVRVCQQTLAL